MLPGFARALLAGSQRHGQSCCSVGSTARSLPLDFYRNFARFESTLLEPAAADEKKANSGLFARAV